MKPITLLPAAALLTVTLLIACSKSNTHSDFAVKDGTQHPVEIKLADATFSSGKVIPLTTGIGSGAFRLQSDPTGIIYTVSDRGPNIDCKDDEKLLGADMCKSGKIFPVPNFTPTIYKYKITDDSADLIEQITIKNTSGADISGLSNPLITTDTEQAFDVMGNPIEYDASGLDTESIVKLSDGTFWLSEEYAPSILHVASDGKVIERLVPAGLEEDLKEAEYPVKGVLPAILMKRKLNRGIESIAVDKDEKNIYFILQSPLANPDSKAYKKSNLVRMFKMDLENQRLIGEFVYKMDKPETFIKDNAKKERKQNDVKISEMVGLSEDKLIVLERISASTKLYEIDLSKADNILGSEWDNMALIETLEQLTDTNIKTVSKTLVFNSDEHDGLPDKIEGVALMKNNKAVVVNDNDFGIAGEKTFFTVITLPLGK